MQVNNIKSRFLILFLIFLITIPVFSQSEWSVENGWVIRYDIMKREKDYFFAVGLWGIPEYKFTPNNKIDSPEIYRKNKVVFDNYTELFNLVYSHCGYSKEYMNNKIIVSGNSEFPWYIRKYMNTIEGNSNNQTNSKYVNMPFLEEQVNRGLLNAEIVDAIDLIKSSHRKNRINNYIWSPIDEVSSWPPNLIESIYKQIKSSINKPLVYIDLTGNGKSRSFNNKHKLPIESNHYDLTFDDEWYQNVKQIANEYRNGGDVFGINSYRDFFQKPKLAGITIDAIKDGVGNDIPVWLWFDSAAYGKPNNIKLDDYIKNVKCQIYTSIIHGASGVMFWTDTNKESKVFISILPIIEDINNLIPIIKSRTLEKNSNGDLHYMIKEYKNKKIAIISNTNKDKSIYITYPFYMQLEPLQVYVSKIDN